MYRSHWSHNSQSDFVNCIPSRTFHVSLSTSNGLWYPNCQMDRDATPAPLLGTMSLTPVIQGTEWLQVVLVEHVSQITGGQVLCHESLERLVNAANDNKSMCENGTPKNNDTEDCLVMGWGILLYDIKMLCNWRCKDNPHVLICRHGLLEGLNQPLHSPIGWWMVRSSVDVLDSIALHQISKLAWHKLGTVVCHQLFW